MKQLRDKTEDLVLIFHLSSLLGCINLLPVHQPVFHIMHLSSFIIPHLSHPSISKKTNLKSLEQEPPLAINNIYFIYKEQRQQMASSFNLCCLHLMGPQNISVNHLGSRD